VSYLRKNPAWIEHLLNAFVEVSRSPSKTFDKITPTLTPSIKNRQKKDGALHISLRPLRNKGFMTESPLLKNPASIPYGHLYKTL
jgi:hypothetical protein